MSIKKLYDNESRKSLSQQDLFEFFLLLFGFQFVSALYYLGWYFSKYPVKLAANFVNFGNISFFLFNSSLFLNM